MTTSILEHKCSYVNVYPEIKRVSDASGKMVITTETVKDFLFENGLLTEEQYHDAECGYQVLATAILRAFQMDILSLNCTKQTGIENNTPVRLTTGHDGKMIDVWSISTLSLLNPFCLRRMQMHDLVCAHCYVPGTFKGINGILKFVQNTFVLTFGLLPDNWIPVIRKMNVKRHPIIRLEALGDLACTVQARNYLATAKKNDSFGFALWTKNPAVLAMAIDLDGKPENLSTVLSMSRVNMMEKSTRYDSYFDHKFIVVDDDKIRDDYLSQLGFYSCQCGPRSCIECRKCYTRHTDDITAVERLRK